jgi:hypothetical protein
MNAYFRKLGSEVHSLWKKENFSPAAFPRIATETLRKNPPSKNVRLNDLIGEFLHDDDQPFQTTSGFGQPELIVFDHPRFYIQVLFWLDGTTDIHQHTFSGAFHVMAGSSIHSRFRFEDRKAVTTRLHLGKLVRESTDLLETGTTVPILSGTSCIHALFHLDTPSVTVVVRTHHDPGSDPQFTYLPPGVAIDPVSQDPLTLRRKQLLDVLERTEHPSYGKEVLSLIQESDLESGFLILQNGISLLKQRGEWSEVWKAFSKKHGRASASLGETLEEILRRDALTAMRGSVEDPEHRFFLALMINVEERREILSMIRSRTRKDPVTTVLRWAGELLMETPGGIWILDAACPDLPGVHPEEQGEFFLAALSHFLRGGKPSPALAALPRAARQALQTALRASTWGRLAATDKDV